MNSPAAIPGQGEELWQSVCRIAKGKGGSKCPGPEVTERERVIEACHALLKAI